MLETLQLFGVLLHRGRNMFWTSLQVSLLILNLGQAEYTQSKPLERIVRADQALFVCLLTK